MCKFCGQGKTLTTDYMAEDVAEIAIVHDDEQKSYLYVETFCQSGDDFGYGSFGINYCPMCGRRLAR